MKWTTVALAVLMQHTADLAYAKTGRIGHVHNRELQSDPELYYPSDINKGICSNDPMERPSSFTELNFTLFETLDECCDFWYSWQQGGNCHRNEPLNTPKEVLLPPPTTTTVPPADNNVLPSSATTPDDTVFFYPMDLITGKCSSDASQRPSNFDSLGFTLFFTAEQCCQYWYGWQQDSSCLLNTPTDSTSGGTLPLPPVTNPVTSPTVVGPPGPTPAPNGSAGGNGSQSGNKFYLVDNILCEASAVREGNFFGTQVECCTNIPDFSSRKICCDESVDSPADQLECLLVEAVEPKVPVEVPVPVVEEEQFYMSNGKCYSSANGVMDGTLYASRFECCNSVGVVDRHSCLWNQSDSPKSQPDSTVPGAMSTTPSSASQLARGGYVIAAVVCLCFQLM